MRSQSLDYGSAFREFIQVHPIILREYRSRSNYHQYRFLQSHLRTILSRSRNIPVTSDWYHKKDLGFNSFSTSPSDTTISSVYLSKSLITTISASIIVRTDTHNNQSQMSFAYILIDTGVYTTGFSTGSYLTGPLNPGTLFAI